MSSKRTLLRRTRVLLGLNGLDQSYLGCFLDFLGFDWVLFGLTWLYWVFTGLNLVFIGFDWVLLVFTGFYLVLFRFSAFC